jgi:hypothetical protein
VDGDLKDKSMANIARTPLNDFCLSSFGLIKKEVARAKCQQ